MGSTVSVQRAANQPEIMLVRNKKVETDIQAQMLSNQVLLLKVRCLSRTPPMKLNA